MPWIETEIDMANSRVFFRRLFRESLRVQCRVRGCCRCLITSSRTQAKTEHYTDEPSGRIYPNPVPLPWDDSVEAVEFRSLQRIERIRTLTSAQEKIYQYTKQQSYTYRVYPMSRCYGTLPFYQYITNTHVIPDTLPDVYGYVSVSEEQVKQVTAFINDMILIEDSVVERDTLHPNMWQQVKAEHIVNQIVSFTHSIVAPSSPHLSTCSVDYGPKIEAFWWTPGGKWRMNITDLPTSQIRTETPLPEFTERDSSLSLQAHVPQVDFCPSTQGLFRKHINPCVSPGYKPGTDRPCCHTQLHVAIEEREKDGEEYMKKLIGNAVSSLHAWTLAYSWFNNFTVEEDIDKPVTAQAIITNGRQFILSSYQLNTIACLDTQNPRNNICWVSPLMNLYETINYSDATLEGLDVNVVRWILKFLLNETVHE